MQRARVWEEKMHAWTKICQRLHHTVRTVIIQTVVSSQPRIHHQQVDLLLHLLYLHLAHLFHLFHHLLLRPQPNTDLRASVDVHIVIERVRVLAVHYARSLSTTARVKDVSVAGDQRKWPASSPSFSRLPSNHVHVVIHVWSTTIKFCNGHKTCPTNVDISCHDLSAVVDKPRKAHTHDACHLVT